MKKTVSAILVALLSCAMILGWRGWQNRAPALEDIRTLDLTQYPVTYKLQEFKLKPHDRQWTLKSFTVYDETGQVEREELYQLDEDGQSYYIAPNGNRIDARRRNFQKLTGALSDWDISREEYDAAGRILSREAACPNMSFDTEILRWYYSPDQPEPDGVCTFVRTMRIVVPPGEKTWLYDGRMESTGYEIDTYDKFGNETMVWIADDCYLKTDADGYLQMIVGSLGYGAWFYVQRVDDYGRPTWQARYGRDGHLYGWSVWEYADLD